jgi:lipoprotein-anchoring transpeptidase ErfK/SrfK
MEFATGPAVIGVANISEHTFTVGIDGVEAGPPSTLPAPHHRPHWGEAGVFPASMGRPEYPTPVGYFLTVEYAVRITSRGLFVHSAPWAVNSLGFENVSHGCISLSPEDAEWYYNTVNVGDPVIVQENSIEVPRAVGLTRLRT